MSACMHDYVKEHRKHGVGLSSLWWSQG